MNRPGHRPWWASRPRAWWRGWVVSAGIWMLLLLSVAVLVEAADVRVGGGHSYGGSHRSSGGSRFGSGNGGSDGRAIGVLVVQNRTERISPLGRDDNGRGLWLRGVGDGGFRAVPSAESGIRSDGDQRCVAIADLDQDGRLDLAITQNQGPTRLYQNRGARPGLRVRLQGTAGNPAGIGAQLRLRFVEGPDGPVKTVMAGSGSGGQDGWSPVLAMPRAARELRVRWPGGGWQAVPLGPSDRSVSVQAP